MNAPMCVYVHLNCQPGQSATACVNAHVQRGKLPANAYKGPLKQDRFGAKVAPQGVRILGSIREHDGTEYYICQAASSA